MRLIPTASSAVLLLPLVFAPLSACAAYHQPTTDQIKGVRVLEDPDLRTLEVFGQIDALVVVPEAEMRRAEELTLDALRAQALREFPDTSLLMGVSIAGGNDRRTYVGSAIAARRRGG